MRNDELILYLLLALFFLNGVVLLIGAIVPTNRRRRLSDWAMLGGMILSLLSFGSFLFLVVFQPYFFSYSRVDWKTLEQLSIAAAFGIAAGLLIFSAGFLLSRFEGRRQRLRAEELGHYGPGGPGIAP